MDWAKNMRRQGVPEEVVAAWEAAQAAADHLESVMRAAYPVGQRVSYRTLRGGVLAATVRWLVRIRIVEVDVGATLDSTGNPYHLSLLSNCPVPMGESEE